MSQPLQDFLLETAQAMGLCGREGRTGGLASREWNIFYVMIS